MYVVLCSPIFIGAVVSIFSNHDSSRIDFLAPIAQLSDLFEDEESADQPPTADNHQQPPRAEAPAVEEVVVDVVDDDHDGDDNTPEGRFLKLSAKTGGVLTLDGLLG